MGKLLRLIVDIILLPVWLLWTWHEVYVRGRCDGGEGP